MKHFPSVEIVMIGGYCGNIKLGKSLWVDSVHISKNQNHFFKVSASHFSKEFGAARNTTEVIIDHAVFWLTVNINKVKIAHEGEFSKVSNGIAETSHVCTSKHEVRIWILK